jgi:hypothetical protein
VACAVTEVPDPKIATFGRGKASTPLNKFYLHCDAVIIMAPMDLASRSGSVITVGHYALALLRAIESLTSYSNSRGMAAWVFARSWAGRSDDTLRVTRRFHRPTRSSTKSTPMCDEFWEAKD